MSHSGVVEFDLPTISQITTEGVAMQLENMGGGDHPGLGWEASHAMDLVAAGTLESPLLPYDVSKAVTHLMEIVRSKLNT